jgi:mannose-1-phosphate guanylyltransferase/mannose-6-phosphate isomerase
VGNPILPVIMCGGAGTRLWPASRESMAKQFIRLFDETTSTFQSTAARVGKGGSFRRPVIIASAESRFTVAEQLLEAGIAADIILEPQPRDSAAAVAVATCYAARIDPEAIVLMLPADHVITDDAAFIAACETAAVAARGGLIMTLGIHPDHPATTYGYIKPGGAIDERGDARRIARFVEKPDLATARGYLADGYLWNSGYFLFRADAMMEELSVHAPEVLEAARTALDAAVKDLDFLRLDRASFATAPKISIDYAVMERTTRAGVLPVSFAWSDVGTWAALWDVLDHDSHGNALRGRVEVLDTSNSLVHSEGDGLTTVVGLDGVIVVATPDAVLVTSRERSGSVKDLVTALRTRNHPEADEHRRMNRPWGWYQRVDSGPRFQVKRIMVKPGGQLSLQKHFHRAEHWIVVRGTAEVTVNDRVSIVHENEAAYIPIGSIHRLANPGRIPLELIEVQVGSYTGEDDILRMDDAYGRSR